MIEKQCSFCNRKIVPRRPSHRWFFEFGTKLYCTQKCLLSYCEERFLYCTHCKCHIQSTIRIKYCTRFGTQLNQFCSSKCMENFKKETSFCKLCLEPIHSFMMISDEEKFCSPFCISRYNGRGINQLKFENSNQCNICDEVGVHHLEMLQDGYSIFFCSKSCVEKYKNKHGTNIFDCSLCGCLLENYSISFYMDREHIFCSPQCSSIFLNSESVITSCESCQVRKYSCDMIKKYRKLSCEYFCSVPCINLATKSLSGTRHDEKQSKRSMRRSPRTSQDSSHEFETDDEMEDENLTYKKIVETVLNKCHTRDLLSKIMQARFMNATEDKETQWNAKSRSIGTLFPPLSMRLHQDRSTQTDIQPMAVPFPVYIPSPVPQCLQFTPTPLVIPLPIPVVVPIPLLKKTKTSKEKKITFSEVAKQFIFKAIAKEDLEYMMPDKESFETEKGSITASNPTETVMKQDCVITDNDPTEGTSDEKRSVIDIGSIKALTGEECMAVDPVETAKKKKCMTGDPIEKAIATANDSIIPVKTEEEGSMVPTKAPTAAGQKFDCIDLTSDTEDNPNEDIQELYLNISGAWSSDSEAMETDDLETTTQSDGKFLIKLIKECDISKNTVKLRETVGKKLWTAYVKRKNRKPDFLSKISHPDTESDKLSNADRTIYLIALLKDYVEESELEPRLVIYIYLCLQKYLSSSCVLDSLFFSVYHHRFGKYFFSLLQNYMNKYSNRAAFYESYKFSNVIRIREEMLWDAYQLGGMSPNVLVFTAFYFNTKYFKLQTVEQHESVTFKRFTKLCSSQTLTDGTPVRLKSIMYNYPKGTDSHKRFIKEISEDPLNHWRCPVKINEFYTSKCLPGAVCTSTFYLTPVLGCCPEAKHWFTAVKLPTEVLQNMLNLTLMVEEIQNMLASDR